MTTEAQAAPGPGRRSLLNAAWMLAATDAALVLLHLGTGWEIVDLDREANLATWYSSAKLLGVALLSGAIGAAASGDRFGRRLWLINAALFVGLSADEAASLHEQLARALLALPALSGLRETVTGGDPLKASLAWIWIGLPLVVAAVLFFAVVGRRTFRGRPGAQALFGAGLALLLGAAGAEASIVAFPPLAEWGAAQTDLYGTLTTIEECAELGGITLLFAALASHLSWTHRRSGVYWALAGSARQEQP